MTLWKSQNYGDSGMITPCLGFGGKWMRWQSRELLGSELILYNVIITVKSHFIAISFMEWATAILNSTANSKIYVVV